MAVREAPARHWHVGADPDSGVTLGLWWSPGSPDGRGRLI